jgi:DeoR-like helix-turn-helix domain
MTVQEIKEKQRLGRSMLAQNEASGAQRSEAPPKDAPTSEVTSETVPIATPATVQDIVDPVVSQYYPALLESVHACLAVCGTMALAGRTKPLSLILETASGYGKSAVLQMLFPVTGADKEKKGVEQYIYRSDKFSPKAFVSHVANVKGKELSAIDLLPKLKNKVLVTKELAPIFRGREEEMQENFATLISVLDGQGFTSDSGTRGKRGYEEPILFNWLGATTPVPPKTHRMMSQLGTRLLFYEVPAIEPTEEQLIEYCERDESGEAERACQKTVNEFLLKFFAQHSVGKLPVGAITLPKPHAKAIARWATLVTHARAEIKRELIDREWEPVSAAMPEGPFKVVNYFKDLARGHALIHGRMEIDKPDIALIGEVAISSIPGHLRPILRLLRSSETLDTPQVATLCKVSAPTARRSLEELSLLGITTLKRGGTMTNAPHSVTLSPGFQWLRNLESKV